MKSSLPQQPHRSASVSGSLGKGTLAFAGGLASIAALAYALVFLQAPHLASMVRARLAAVLSEQLSSPVRLGPVQTRFDGGLEVVVHDLEVQSVLRGVPGDPAHPMLRVRHLDLRIRLLQAMLGRIAIDRAAAQGIAVDLPPSPTPAATLAPNTPVTTVYLGSLTLDDAHVTFAAGDPAHAPMRFDISHADLTGMDRGGPFAFKALVDSGAPIGMVETSGTAGPWNLADPRGTPLDGTFSFAQRDIRSVHGLRGNVSMQASYHGTLGTIDMVGNTHDPTFGLDVSAHTVDMRTNFAMQIDAVHGVVHIPSLHAHFFKTQFDVNGTVTKDPATSGYVLDLALDVPQSRVEDALTLFAHTEPTLLQGGLMLQGRLHMPGGSTSVSRKLRVTDGRFQLTGAQFGRADVQRSADALSERASGDPEQAQSQPGHPQPGHAELRHAGPARRSSVWVDGNFTLQNGVIQIARAHLTAPGTESVLAGRYTLGGTGFDLHGTVHSAATASQMHTGIKSLLLRPFNGLFSHGHAGTTLPLRVTGSGNVPRFRVTLPGGVQQTVLD